MPSSDCELLLTEQYCRPPPTHHHNVLINTETTTTTGVNGRKTGTTTIHTAPVTAKAAAAVVVPDKQYGDVNHQSSSHLGGPGNSCASHGYMDGDCWDSSTTTSSTAAAPWGKSTKIGHGMNGYQQHGDHYSSSGVEARGEGEEGENAAAKEILCQTLEKRHVHDVYEDTAHHFTQARYKPWPKVREFLENLPTGAIMADIGCGHGKYLDINPCVYKLGSDRSSQLMQIAAQHSHEVMVCDNLSLPYRTGCFDAVISVGVIHHLTSPQRRLQAVTELARVLRPSGRLMIYVWALEQKHRKFGAQDVLVPWHLKQKTGRQRRQLESSNLRQATSVNGADNGHKGLIHDSGCRHHSSMTNNGNPESNGSQLSRDNHRAIMGGCAAITSGNAAVMASVSEANIHVFKQGTAAGNTYSVINKTSPGSVSAVSNVEKSKCETDMCQSSSVSKNYDSTSNGKASSNVISEPYQEHKSKSGRLQNISNEEFQRVEYDTEKPFCSDGKDQTKVASVQVTCVNKDGQTNQHTGHVNTAVSAMKTPSADASFGAVIRKKLTSLFSFSNKFDKKKVSENTNTSTTAYTADETSPTGLVPLLPGCCGTPTSLICSDFAVREFPQSSQPGRGRLGGVSQYSQDLTEELLPWQPTIECINTAENVLSSHKTPKYASVVDSLRLQLVAAEQQKKDLNWCSYQSAGVTQRVPTTTSFQNIPPHNYREEDGSTMSHQKLKQSQSEGSWPGEKHEKSNGRGGQSNKLLKKFLHTQSEHDVLEDPVKFTLGEDDSHWLMTAGEVIQKMELAVQDKANHTGVSSGHLHSVQNGEAMLPGKHWLMTTGEAIQNMELAVQDKANHTGITSGHLHGVQNGESIIPGKISSPRLQRLSQSSSVSSFSSENFSDSEVEETSIGVKQRGTGGVTIASSQGGGVKDRDRANSQGSPRLTLRNNCNTTKCDKSNTALFDESSRDTYKRYYHVFRENELDNLITKNLKCLKIVHSAYDHANWYIIAEKLAV